MKENIVYMLLCSNQSYYTGWTNDFIKRMTSHKKGTASHFTRAFLPLKIVYIEVCESRSEAMHKEAQIKKMTRAQKESMIASSKTRTQSYLNNHPFEYQDSDEFK